MYAVADKPFVCDVCGQSYKYQMILAEHKKTHKINECDICKKTFSQSKHLVNHKRIHMGEKPYECDICKKTFISSGTITDHERVHTGEKPYSCDVCQKSFAHRSALLQHNKRAAHIERMKSKKVNIPLTQSSFVDCGESIKEEDIKEEINEDESVDDPLSIHKEKTSDESENIVTKLKEEGIEDYTPSVEEIHKFGDGENNTVVDDIDIVEHKIETD